MTKRNHKQINGQIISVISEHFDTLFLFLTSPSVCTPDCVFVLLQDIQSQFEHCSCPMLKTRQMTHLNAGCFAGFSVWSTCPYRNDGTLRKHKQHIYCSGYCFSWSVWSFHPEISRQSNIFSCLHSSHRIRG